MRLDRLSRAASLVLACAVLAACGESTAPKLAPLTVDSLLTEIGETQAYGTPGLIFTGATAFGAMPSAAACPFNSSNQRFVCAPVVFEGITTNRYFQLLDAGGTPQAEFNRATTAAFRTVADVEGSITIDIPALTVMPAALTITIASHEDQTLSGLLTGTHTLNGTGNSTTSFDDAEFGGTIATSWTTTNLVLPKRGKGNKYPQSGSIAMSVTADELVATITMTFNGTSIMTMTIVSGGITTTCQIDMANPDSSSVCGD